VTYNDELKVSQQTLQLDTQLYEDNKKRADLGAIAPIDIIQAEADMKRRPTGRGAARKPGPATGDDSQELHHAQWPGYSGHRHGAPSSPPITSKFRRRRR